MRLTKVAVSGFRALQSVGPLPIGKPMVLAGHNDAGKSSLLTAVRFLLGDYVVLKDDRTLVPADGQEPKRVTESWVEGEFVLSSAEQAQLRLPEIIRFRRVSTEFVASSAEVLEVLPDNEHLRGYSLKDTRDALRARVDAMGLTTLKNVKESLIEVLDAAAATAPTSEHWNPAGPELVRALPRVETFNAESVSNPENAIRDSLQNSYKDHLDSDKYSGKISKIERQLEQQLVVDADLLRAHIGQRVDDIGDISITPSVSLKGNLTSTTITTTNALGEAVPLGRAGTGRARRVAFAVWEFTTARLAESDIDKVLLYDEPDTHLDYQRQREFMSVVVDQATRSNLTIIIASHSMNLIDGVDISDVAHVRLDNQMRTEVVRLNDDSDVGKHLGSIATSVGLRNTVLIHERLFVGVEGATEGQAIPVLFKKAMGRQLESFGIALWPCDNHEGAMKFARYLHDHGRRVAFLVDADAANIPHVFSNSNLRKVGLDPDTQCYYIGDPNEFEDLFSDADWAEAADAVWPRSDGEAWDASDIGSLRAAKFSKGLLEHFRTGSDNGPAGKPEMMAQLALFIPRERIPQQLVERFSALIDLAR